MILTDRDIKMRIAAGAIKISDYDPNRLGSNSYDLRLGQTLLTYNDSILDSRKDNPYEIRLIPESGQVLQPGELYLGYTLESTWARDLVPQLEGKSSMARLGIQVHLTAGFGDIGFNGHWTLEISVIKPVIIYPKMPIAQIYFMLPLGECDNPYHRKNDAKYNDQQAKPVPSSMWKNFPLK